jgi:hypothetical protein
MEHRQQAQKSVNLEATLIGRRTVPKGCRVLNVSQQGMSLQCEPDGRLLTFNNGDSVDIHLSAHHADGHNKFTIPAIVSHVDENTVDVVFHCTDAELAGLIESYRTSEAHKLEASIGHRKKSPQVAENSPVSTQKEEATINQAARPMKERSRRPMFEILLFVLLASTVSLAFYVYNKELNIRLGELEKIISTHSDVLTEMQPHIFTSSLQDGKYASLNARFKAMGDAFRVMEGKLLLLTAQQETDDLTVPEIESATVKTVDTETKEPVTDKVSTTVMAETQAAPKAVTSQQTHTASNKTVATADRSESPAVIPDIQPDPVIERPVPVVNKSVPDNKVITSGPEDGGPWVINLISSRDRGYVSRYADGAQAKGIQAEVTNAEVKGREYWRLQIKGFQTMAEAKSFSEPIKEKLGLKDVWIFKRK